MQAHFFNIIILVLTFIHAVALIYLCFNNIIYLIYHLFLLCGHLPDHWEYVTDAGSLFTFKVISSSDEHFKKCNGLLQQYSVDRLNLINTFWIFPLDERFNFLETKI